MRRMENRLSEPRKCPNCSAIAKQLDERFCGFCGTEMPRVGAAAPLSPPRFGNLAARFIAVAGHPQRAEIMRRKPADGWITNTLALRAVFGVVFGGIGLSVGLPFAATIILAPFALIPLLFTAIGGWVLYDALRRRTRFMNARLLRVPALVVGERTKVTGGGRNSSATTTYFVTLQYDDGERHELRTKGAVIGEVTDGDIGYAFVRDIYLLDFARLNV